MSTDPSLDVLLQYSMIFLSRSRDQNGPGYLPAGSGTFVEIGGFKGILTAGHVIRELLANEDSEFRIGVLNRDRSTFAGLTCDTALCRPFCLLADPVTEDGPDIGFLALPDATVQSVLTNWNFHNLDQRYDLLRDFELPKPLRVVVVGLPAARSSHIEVVEDRRTDKHEIFQMVGNTASYRQDEDGFDTFRFTPNNKSAGLPVEDFKGVSGGAAWVVGADDKLSSRLLYGVTFFQSDLAEGQRYLVCHGPASIYMRLRNEILTSADELPVWTGSV